MSLASTNSACIGLFSFFISFSCFASSFSGFVTVSEKKMTLTSTSTRKVMSLLPLSKDILEQLSKLKSGDYLSIEGTTDNDQSILFVTSINYVGLKDILGDWIGDDDYCYKFSSFFLVKIYNKNDYNQCDFALPYLVREFIYFTNPSDEGWSVLLSDNDDSYLMDLTLDSKYSAQLSLYDSQSGDILRKIQIRRP